jgi:hypothetical protein
MRTGMTQDRLWQLGIKRFESAVAACPGTSPRLLDPSARDFNHETTDDPMVLNGWASHLVEKYRSTHDKSQFRLGLEKYRLARNFQALFKVTFFPNSFSINSLASFSWPMSSPRNFTTTTSSNKLVQKLQYF